MTITIHGSVAEMVKNQMVVGSYQSPEDLVYEALEVLSQAVHEDTVRLSMGTVIQQGPRIAERQFL